MDNLIHHSLLRQKESNPDQVAFRCRGESITYGNLYEHCSRLAYLLQELGTKPEDRIGIYMSKSLEMPIATYATLMAGGCYVPIDPDAPSERVAFILKNCGIETLITLPTKGRDIERLNASPDLPLRNIIGLPNPKLEGVTGHDWNSIHSRPANFETPKINQHSLAYIMYTSGSTGTPKGLMHTHESALAYAKHSQQLYSVSSDDILANHAPLHFDISTFEFITGPYAGATTVLIPEEEKLFPAALAESIETEKFTFWYSVPLALVQLLSSGVLSDTDTSSLRWVLFGGEPLAPKHLLSLMELIPTARFCNVYGPAEVNQCTYFHIPSAFSNATSSIPLGYVWEGAEAKIVSQDDEEAESDESGELLICSKTMMRGYWERDDLNQTAFYFTTDNSGTMKRYYRTGDLVSKDSNGLLHFLGRKDRQVKIRGYRVELDEIESVFAAQEDIESAAVVLVCDELGDMQLIVCVIPYNLPQFDSRTSLTNAKKFLPRYAVPSRLEVLNHFPKTTSGKIDRNALSTLYDNQIATA